MYLINRMPSQVLFFSIPLQTLTQHIQIPSLLHLELRVFGCVAYVHLQKTQRTKLEPCAILCVSDTKSLSSFPLLSAPCYSLPHSQNRGKAPDRYSLNGKVKYAITQYVSTHKL
jgi:hypothetical protein